MQNHRPGRRLATYRAWLAACIALSVTMLCCIPFAATAPRDPAVILPGVGVLLGWWAGGRRSSGHG
jgi:hypothetical protein